jgi:hypothetical protein
MEATKKFRDIFAYGFLVVAGLYLISGVSLLSKSGDGIGPEFSTRAALFGHLFAHPVLVFSLVAAVTLAVGFGEASRSARTVVLVALGMAGVSLLLAVVCWLGSLGAYGDLGMGPGFGGVVGAGNVVGTVLSFAQLLLLGLATGFAYTSLQSLPKAARSPSWGQPQNYGGQQGYGQPSWGQPGADYPGQSQWGQSQPGWGAGPPGGAPAPTGATAVGGWGDQFQAQAERQGQPASAWTAAEQGYPQQGEQPQPAWGQPGHADHGSQPAQTGPQQWQQPVQPQPWNAPATPDASQWGPPPTPAAPGSAATQQPDPGRPDDPEQDDPGRG